MRSIVINRRLIPGLRSWKWKAGTPSITERLKRSGRSGLDSTNPTRMYHLKSLDGALSGLQLVCMMYVGLKQIAPELDIGFDVSKEYAEALRLFENKSQAE
jgi:hypothetical protein